MKFLVYVGSLFLLLHLTPFPIYAQKNKAIDSLETLIKKTTVQDTNTIKNLILLGKLYLSQNNGIKAIESTENALKIAQEIQSKKFIGYCESEMGHTYLLLGDITEALNHAQKGFEAAEESKNDIVIVQSLQILGKIYERQGKIEETTKLYEKALNIRLKNPKNIPGLAIAYNNLGNINAIAGNFEKALHYQNKALELRLKEPTQAPNLTFSYNDIGYIYFLKRDFEKAAQYYLKAVENAEKFGDKVYIGFMYNNAAGALVELKQYEKAKIYAEKGLKASQKSNSKGGIADAYQILSTVYKNEKNFENAFFYQEKYVAYRDSLLNEKQLEEITKLENSFAVNQEKKKNELQQKISEAKIQQQFYVIVFIIAGLLLLSVTVLLLWRNNHLKQKNNHLLMEKNEEIKQQNEEIKQIADTLQEANDRIVEQTNLIQEQHQNIVDNITYSQRIQEAILPSQELIKQHLPESFILYQPKDIVSGDFYFFETQKDSIIAACIDCTGHGVSGAFMTILANDILLNIINQEGITSADLILNQLHKNIRKSLKQYQSDNQDGMDIGLLVIDKKENKLQFAGAKHSLTYIQNGEIKQIKGSRYSIGGEQTEAERTFTAYDLAIESPTYLYLFSDGYTDQFGGEHRRKFSTPKMQQLLHEIHALPLPEQRELGRNG
ncbi:MAG: hypothetical protein EAZ55_12910 [Cytophagales bacterium]|nr:MAG: hypothetical protein EAZ55_12910 [Cytophagales bacterium]